MERRAGYPVGPRRGTGETRALVLKWAKVGLGARDIATQLGVSTQTVYLHLQRLRADGDLKEAS